MWEWINTLWYGHTKEYYTSLFFETLACFMEEGDVEVLMWADKFKSDAGNNTLSSPILPENSKLTKRGM